MRHFNVLACSPYLRRTRRSLPEACRDITRRHRPHRPPCETCPLADLWAHAPNPQPLAEARPQAMARQAENLAHRSHRQGPGRPAPGGRRPVQALRA